jgi:hypothetical protein
LGPLLDLASRVRHQEPGQRGPKIYSVHAASRSPRHHSDISYCGHSYPDRFKVYISGQARQAIKVVRREMRRRAASNP